MTICRRIDPALASVLNRLRELFHARGSHDRQIIATEVNSTLEAARTDLALARYEPVAIRASDGWLFTRTEAIERSRYLCLLLILAKDSDDVPRGLIDKRLTALSANLFGHELAKSDAQSFAPTVARGLTLSGLIEENLTDLEGILRSPANNLEMEAHALP